MDIDDKFDYSEVRKVSFDIAAQLSLSVLGNPFQSTLSISISSVLNEKAVLALYDITGRSIWIKTTVLQKGINYFSVDGSVYPSGSYILSLNVPSGIKKTVKVAKQ